MSSCIMKNPDSDEEVDLEVLRLAALKSRKPKYARVNHNNLIPIVPVAVNTPDFVHTKIKKEKVSPTPEGKVQETGNQLKGVNKENEEEKGSNYSTSTVENDQDILSMDDKEEEDSLERLMDQLEAEISGKAPLPTNRIVLSSKNSTSGKKDGNRKTKKTNEGGDDEIELVQVKSGREPGAVIEIRESASPETFPKAANPRKSGSREPLKRRSRSRLRSRSRSPFSRARSYRRSRSPYWSRSPRRSRSPFRRSRSPFWMSRRSRSSSRSPFSRRYRSPGRRRSPFARFSRSRSRSFERRRSWSLSPRRRSKSPLYGLPLPRRRNFNSPLGRRRSFSPRDGSKSPRRRSRSPRRFPRNSPFRRSKSPFRRSRSPIRRSPIRRSQSPYLNRSKSPFSKLNSPNRSPLVRERHSKTPPRRLSLEKASSKPRSKSPVNKYGSSPRRSPGRLVSKDARDFRFSTSPTPRRNRSPLRVVEKNKQDDRNESYRGRNRNEKRHRSLSRENRRSYRQRYFRKFSPSKSRKSSERQTHKSKSPKSKEGQEKNKEGSKQTPKEKEPSPTPAVPPDPVLEARKKKFENLNEVDPTKDKKISLKSIKESSENVEDDEDALTINVEGNLWDESEESEDEFESRFKSNEARKNLPVAGNRIVLSFRNLREGDAANRKINLNKPLIDDRRDRFGSRSERHDRWQGRRNDRRKRNYPEGSKSRSEDDTSSKNRRSGDRVSSQRNSRSRDLDRRSDRKPFASGKRNEGKTETKDNEVSTTLSEGKSGEKSSNENKDKPGKGDADMHDADDFDKLISDFEKELESDICISTKEPSSTVGSVQSEVKRSKISVKKDLFEPEISGSSPVKRPTHRAVKLYEASTNKPDKEIESKSPNKPAAVDAEKVEESQQKDGPEDYVEDDDFFLEVNARQKQKSKGEEEDSQSDLRAVLSRRRNERLTKAVSLQENMPTRLVQSAFQGLGNKKSNRQIREVQETLEVPSFDRSVKSTGGEGRRVLLLQREKNPSVPSVKCTVPEVKPDTTIYQRFTRSTERRKRKLQRQLDPVEDVDQEEEEEGFEVEEEKQSRRFRLKRNVTLSSQSSRRRRRSFTRV